MSSATNAIVHQLANLAGPFHSRLEHSGKHFRRNLSATDVAQVTLARNIFLGSTLLPPLAYVFCVKDARMPATISYIGRQGVPFYIGNSLWLLGWGIWLEAFYRQGDNVTFSFAFSMWVCGLVLNTLCPLGKSWLQDWIHFVAAFVYIVDHEVLFYLCNHPSAYVWFSRLDLLIFFTATPIKMGLQKRLG
eukprot:CAMPEP_0172925976 /NCGR_PEP_ID=MMETSP1075-20121228/214738_1 /TAXON_ID=2916 /ORGANISM="Ceratium fusus, Strain PA161109" /LENGTH=189 /DNA_ID=CAMNT_0013786949 /DNA_START=5 /DNA_END=570 /DNA_ORIENTATION=+